MLRRVVLLTLLAAAACAPKPRAVARGRSLPPPPAVSPFQVRAAEGLAQALEFAFEPIAPIGPGFYARVRSPKVEGEAIVYLGPDPEYGRWTFGSEPPEEVLRQARLTRVSGVVRLDTARGRIHGEARLTIQTGGARLLPLYLHVPPGGVSVETAEGVACPVKVIAPRDLVVVELPSASERVELVVRWEGKPPQIDHCHVRKSSVLLPGAYPWMPTLPETDATFEMTLVYPKRFDLLPGGRAGRVTTLDGLRAVRTTFRGREPVTLVGRTSWVRRPLELEGVPVTIALKPKDIERLPELERNVRLAFSALRPLGPLPHRLQIAWSPQPAFQGIASRGFIGIDDFDPHVIAHELAHQYFHDIDDSPPPLKAWTILPDSREWSGDWTEAIAEYLATWAKTESEARAHRLSWSFRYAHVPDTTPLREIRDKGLPADDPRHVVVYTKGPLLLAEMERRLGREKMAQAIATFIRENHGKRADWADLADAFGGEDARWLRRWLATPGSPRLTLDALRVKDGHLEGVVRAEPADFEGVLQVGVITDRDASTLRMDQSPRVVRDLAFSGAETPFRIALPEGAAGLLLDPEYRLPRRWEGFDGLFVVLPAEE